MNFSSLTTICCIALIAMSCGLHAKDRNIPEKEDIEDVWIGFSERSSGYYMLQLQAKSGTLLSALQYGSVVQYNVTEWSWDRGIIKAKALLVDNEDDKENIEVRIVGNAEFSQITAVIRGRDWKREVKFRRLKDVMDGINRLRAASAGGGNSLADSIGPSGADQSDSD